MVAKSATVRAHGPHPGQAYGCGWWLSILYFTAGWVHTGLPRTQATRVGIR